MRECLKKEKGLFNGGLYDFYKKNILIDTVYEAQRIFLSSSQSQHD